MRGAAVFLLLCLYWTWAQCEAAGENRKEDAPFEIQGVKAAEDQGSRQTNATPDIWTKLKELRDMAIEQKVELRYSQNKMAMLEQENTALKARMSTSENQVKELKRKNTEVEARLTSTDNKMLELKAQTAGLPKVAFSLGLSNTGGFGPFGGDTTLKFSKVFYNYGDFYNPASGVFTAPVRGAYYFRFTAWEYFTSNQMAVSLYHNGKMVMYNYDMNDENFVNMSNALILQMEKGDTVHMTLPSGYSLYDDRNNLVTFSGFLLFTV